jgi:ATP-dependent Clp protease ATP-binding subunit ClpA
VRPLESFLARGAEEARRAGAGFIGTEHVLSALVREPSDARLLRGLGVEPGDVERRLACWLAPGPARIDAEALATLGIDLETVRERLERTFGAGALERTTAGCLPICPRLKRALERALGEADGAPGAEHVLLGLLAIDDCVAARVLAEAGVTSDAVRSALGGV